MKKSLFTVALMAMVMASCTKEMPVQEKVPVFYQITCCPGDPYAEPATEPCTVIVSDPATAGDQCRKLCGIPCDGIFTDVPEAPEEIINTEFSDDELRNAKIVKL